jgi:flagellar biosynthesis GTPase FlhF
MRIEVIWAPNSRAGMTSAIAQYGENVVLLSNRKIGSRSRLLVGLDSKIQATDTLELRDIKSVNHVVPPTMVREAKDYELITNLVKNELAKFKKETEAEHYRKVNYGGVAKRIFGQSGVSRELSNLLSNDLSTDANSLEISDHVISKLTESLPETIEIDLGTKTHVLCGNYGSGKTSIAIKFGLKLLELCETPPILVSYKQGLTPSSASMEAISKSLGIPIFEVSDIDTLKLIESHLSSDGILIVDTATRNISEEILLIKDNLQSVNFHLIAASDSYAAAQEHLISAANWSSIIITRLDLAPCQWPIIETLIREKIPLSLGSRSSNINDGLVRVTKETLAKRSEELLRKSFDSDETLTHNERLYPQGFNQLKANQ